MKYQKPRVECIVLPEHSGALLCQAGTGHSLFNLSVTKTALACGIGYSPVVFNCNSSACLGGYYAAQHLGCCMGRGDTMPTVHTACDHGGKPEMAWLSDLCHRGPVETLADIAKPYWDEP